MADKPDKKPDAPAGDKKETSKAAPAAAAAPAAGGGGGGFLTKTPILLGGAMLVEAVVLIVGFKIIGGSPKAAAGADVTSNASKDDKGDKTDKTDDKKKTVEIPLLDPDFRAEQRLGKVVPFEVKIVVSTKAELADKVKQAISDHEALITDRVRTIIAQSDPGKLNGSLEPGLETVRRQVKFQLDEIIGDGMIDDVFVPKCIPYRTDN